MPLLLAVSPGNLPRINDESHVASVVSTLDWHVLAFTFAIALLTGVLFGLLPALRISKLDVNSVLKEASGRSGTGLRHNRVRSILVAAEMALAVILVAGAASHDPHLRRIALRPARLRPAQRHHHANVVEWRPVRQHRQGRKHDSPGGGSHRSAAGSARGGGHRHAARRQAGLDLPFNIEGVRPPRAICTTATNYGVLSARIISARCACLCLRGRAFDQRDTGNSARVVIINQAFAKKYWPKGDPIGQRITIGKGLGPEFEEPAARRSSGSSANVRETGLKAAIEAV